MMDYLDSLGFQPFASADERQLHRQRLVSHINLQLVAHGHSPVGGSAQDPSARDALEALSSCYARTRGAGRTVAPVDQRIERFLSDHLADVDGGQPVLLPTDALVLPRHGLAREMALPVSGDVYRNAYVNSYRVKNGILHNPLNDRRTTKGTFHIVEGGFPIPGDKKAVPKRAFAELMRLALHPPRDLALLPFTADEPQPSLVFVSLLVRPLVRPAIAGLSEAKRMEIRFFAPGGLVSNLDFVESIFGNAGDPFLADNDAALDVHHWSGHTGAVILAPHVVHARKSELGLPHVDEATERQRRDGMCWREEDERYNDGIPFKLTCRSEAGVVVTLIADNYFGYCKKEVKTQVSYAANLLGNAEEEHAGGAIVFPSYNLGEDFVANSRRFNNRTFADVARDYAAQVDVKPEGYGIDRQFPDLIYIPETAHANVPQQRVKWTRDGVEHSIPLLPGKIYMAPSGYKVRLEKHPEAPSWRLIGTSGEGTFCHKPCTVSGGGKSEISKPVRDYMLYGPIFVADFEKDLDLVQQIFEYDYSQRWRPEQMPDNYGTKPSRRLLDSSRSLGSVIKLLTPSPDYTDAYNRWLASIPNHVYALVFIIKRFYQPAWNGDWRSNFSVDIVNGTPGHELKYIDRKLVGTYLRVGLAGAKHWRIYKLRQDFAPAAKIPTEDDISASTVVPAERLEYIDPELSAASYKFAENCEYRLFQRPDDAIHRGLDKKAEADLARPGNFISNFEPLTHAQVAKMAEYVVDLDKFTAPMQQLLRQVEREGSGYVVCSAAPRLIDGEPTENPRYLQDRSDLESPMDHYVAQMGQRLWRAVPADKPVPTPVSAILFGRRNNPPDRAAGIRSLAVYNPLHYQELPELFMDFITSLSGKSPSTTGAGSEGALTKGPFNNLPPIIDLNNALVAYLLTELAGFSTPAGYIGPGLRVDHDLSLLMPEIWCRLTVSERNPQWLIQEKLLEPLPDYRWQGQTILASRLGYRINERFVARFFGRVFDNPSLVFDELVLYPERQDADAFAEGVLQITEAQQRIARTYFDDGSIRRACPPLQALLHIMAHGSWEGCDVRDARVRQMFSRDALLESDWYQQRLEAQQRRDIALWQRHVQHLEQWLTHAQHARDALRLDIAGRLAYAREQQALVQSPAYRKELIGMLGLDPFAFSKGEE